MSMAEEMEAGRNRSRYFANLGASRPQPTVPPQKTNSAPAGIPSPFGESITVDTGIVAAITAKQPQAEGVKRGTLPGEHDAAGTVIGPTGNSGVECGGGGGGGGGGGTVDAGPTGNTGSTGNTGRTGAQPSSSAGQAKQSGTSKDDEIASFMSRVVPWPRDGDPGFINLHYTVPNRDGMPGRPYTDLKSFLGFARGAATKPDIMKDIYFCLTRQSAVALGKNGEQKAKRLAKNATHAKALWIDADVKPDQPEKNYTSTAALVTAFEKFLADASLPPPSALVMSGSGGMHIYWISDRPLTITEWQPYAEGLSALVVKYGFKCDVGLTTDAARVLRVPGTYNRKRDPAKPVVLKGLGRDYDFDTALAHLAAIKPAGGVSATVTRQPIVPMKPFEGYRPPAIMASLNPQDSLAAGIRVHDDRPLNPDEVFKHCPHFQDATLTHGAGYGQGLWMLDVLASTFLDDGLRWAHYISKGHKTYDKDDTDAMYARKVRDRKEKGLGWPGCHAFESEGCKLCATCAHLPKNKSPLHLALPQQAPSPPVQPSFVDPYAEFAGPRLPLEVLPPTLRKFVDAEHRAMGADPSAIAMAALTAVAGAMHAETVMRVGEGWWERPILWTALVGQPSTMKSPIIDKTRKPLSGVDHERDKRWRQEFAIWQQQNKK